MKNKLLRLLEIIQDGYPENILVPFKLTKPPTLDERIVLICQARDYHQKRSETLWLQAGKSRSPEERRAAAQAEVASFIFAYLTGDAKEYAESAIAAMVALGRHGEVEIIKILSRR